MPEILVPSLWMLLIHACALMSGDGLVGRRLSASGLALRLAVSWLAGLGILSHLLFLLAALDHLTKAWAVGAVILVGVAGIALGGGRGWLALAGWRPQNWTWMEKGMALAMLLIGLWIAARIYIPVYGATDALAYHMAVPKTYTLHQGFHFNPTIKQSLYPQQVEMLFGLGLLTSGEAVSQSFAMAFFSSLLLGVFHIARSAGDQRLAGLMAMLGVASLTVVHTFAARAFVDIALAAHGLLAIIFLFRWRDSCQRLDLILSAAFMGMALACKHNALVLMAALALVLAHDAIRRREGRGAIVTNAALWGAVALAWVSPWYLRSLIYTGNPVWPMLAEIFPSPYYRHFIEGRSTDPFTVTNIAAHPFRLGLEVSFKRIFMGLWYPAVGFFKDPQRTTGFFPLAFLPFAVYAVRSQSARTLAVSCLFGYLLYVFALRSTPRYAVLFFVLLVAAGAAGWAQAARRHAVWKILGLLLLAGVMRHEARALWQYTRNPYHNMKVAGGDTDRYRSGLDSLHEMYSWINTNTPPDSVILLQGIVEGYWCDRDYYWDHPSQTMVDYTAHSKAASLAASLRQLGVTHVLRFANLPRRRVEAGYPNYSEDALQVEFTRTQLAPLHRITHRDGRVLDFYRLRNDD